VIEIGTLDIADVVVVGGGIVGLSTAYELRKRGFDVVVVEQRFLAFGASGRNPGAVWLQLRRQGTELDLARRTVELYQQYEQEIGAIFELRRHGGLFFYETEEQRAVLERYVEDRAGAGLDISFVSRDKAIKLAAALPDSALGAVYCADDAQVDASASVRALGSACHRLGVRSFENTAVLSTIRRGDRIVGVRTVRGEVHAAGVVWATGAWAVNLRAEGIDLPIITHRVGQLVTQPITYRSGAVVHGPRGVAGCGALLDLPGFDAREFAAPAQMTGEDADYDDVLAQNTEGALLVGNSIDGPGSLNPHISMRATQAMIGATMDRTDLGGLGVTGLWAGLVGATPDQLPIIDRIEGLYINAGHSFGVASGPSGGEAMAALVAGETSELTAALRVDRPALDPDPTVG
jgi:glycine/D-amino acid oxidase-like deaminating enzyme